MDRRAAWQLCRPGPCDTLRAGSCKAPILFLTTLGGVGDRVSGLDAGADDYLTKPFAFAELVARVNALGRRPYEVKAQTALRVGDPFVLPGVLQSSFELLAVQASFKAGLFYFGPRSKRLEGLHHIEFFFG